MADEKTYSEDEHIAILADRVTRETADLTAERDQLAAEKADLETQLDVETSAKQAAELRATEAEKSLADFKAEVEQREEAAARKDERVAKVREVAAHLDDSFFEDEARIKRIVAMDEEAFTGYLSDLGASTKTPGKTTTDVPRETAMTGDKVVGAQPASSGRNFLMRGFVVPSAQEG